MVHEHAKGWIKAGHKVTLFSSFYKGGLNSEVIDGVNVIRKGYQILGAHVAGFLWYVFGKHDKYDLVIDQFHGIPFFTPLFVRRPKLAVLQEVAKDVWFLNDFPFPLNLVIGFLGYISEPIIFLLYQNVDFMVGSNSAKEDLIKVGIPSLKITIVPHGVIIKHPKPFFPKEKIKTVMFLGALAKDKGVEDAIKVFSLLNKKGKYNFWIVGRGGESYVSKLLSMCKELGLDNKVKFWGFVDQAKKFELLARSHILINPSAREGWGLVNIEANAMGTPIVAYDVPGLVDSIKDGQSGLLVKKNLPEELAKTTIEILGDKEKYKHLQIRALAWSKNFSWEDSRKLSLSLLESVSRNS